MNKTYLSDVKKIKNTKHNDWFINVFLKSFGLCSRKNISEKQGEVFKKYLQEEPDNWKHANANCYSILVNGLYIRLQESGCYNGSTYTAYGRKALYRSVFSLTIAEDQTEKEIEIKKELEIVTNKIDAMYEENPDNPEIDIEEEKEEMLYKKLDDIYKSYH